MTMVAICLGSRLDESTPLFKDERLTPDIDKIIDVNLFSWIYENQAWNLLDFDFSLREFKNLSILSSRYSWEAEAGAFRELV